jgi:para-aminobenzoate synthetase component I
MYISLLPYQADGAGVFSHFAQKPYAVFIDSCGVGRFDIIAANPTAVIETRDWHDDPFSLAKAKLLSAEIQKNNLGIPQDLPFTLGAIGYLSYDLGYELMQLTPTPKANVGLPTAVIGFYDWSVVTDHHQKKTYLISEKDPRDPDLAAIKALIGKPSVKTEAFSLTKNFLANMDKLQYTDAFEKIKTHIRAGDCYQINLAQRFSATFQGSPWSAYQSLRTKNPMPMAAYMNLADDAILCLSPERFLQVSQNQVTTQPIKGTSPRFAEPAQDQQSAENLLNSIKDRAENIMIVDLLRNDLSKCCRPGSVKVPQLCALESFTNVHHLVSTVIGALEEGRHPLDLLKSCFPGGSITGAPKRRAMEIIDQLEPHHRALYCGSIFYCDQRGNMDSNIAIRTLLCHGQEIHCYGGGGIVSDSNLDGEYQEIQVKISKLLNILETV